MPTELDRVRAELRIAKEQLHRGNADRADLLADVYMARMETARAEAAASRTHAEAVTVRAAIAEVRRLCDLTISASMRVQARDQAEDTLAVIDSITGTDPLPGDAAWGKVWLHGNWRDLTAQMTIPEREHAADAVARWSAALNADDPDLEGGELEGLRWWRD